MASHGSVGVREDDIESSWPEAIGQGNDTRASLVRRVLGSSTFEHCPKLRSFLEYVSRCALQNEPAAATEPQIGIHVFGRPAGYNTNEDNIVRSQARLLRLKLEHHFANEGRNEPLVITIPKGRYLPVFESRSEHSVVVDPEMPSEQEEVIKEQPYSSGSKENGNGSKTGGTAAFQRRWLWFAFGCIAALVLMLWAVRIYIERHSVAEQPTRPQAPLISGPQPAAIAHGGLELRIAAGNTGAPLIDASGRQWAADEFYQGGVSEPGPQDFFPPVANPRLFSRIREGATLNGHTPMGFRYDIPMPPGVYELRLYFADPIRHAVPGHDGQHLRHFQINLNGNPILTNFDAVSDGGSGAVDIRAFRDVSPAQDGKIHLEFLPSPDRPFLSALELSPGILGSVQPIRFTAHTNELVDANGLHWSGDEYFIDGNTLGYSSPEGAKVQPLYSMERFGNFSYAIPVPPGSYTVRLHFMETYWGPSAPNGFCSGVGCRIFDVACNGQMLLKNFDIVQAAGSDFVPVVRTFTGLHPNGQGKLLLTFSPSVDYAEVRAIEVIDERPATPTSRH